LTVGPAGSGAQFTEIQAAIDAAQDDDVILVQPGTYQKIDVARPLRILGDGTGSVTVAAGVIVVPGFGLGVTVSGIRAGEDLVLSGIDVLGNGDPTDTDQVLIRDCQGTVILQDMVVQAGASDTGLEVERCSRVMVLDSRITGGSDGAFFGGNPSGSGIQAANSTLWIANSEIACEALFPFASPGVEVRSCTLHVWRTSIRGADLGGELSDEIGDDGGHGLLAVGSTVNLFGGPGSAVIGGQGSLIEDPIEIGHYAFQGGYGLNLTQGSHARVQASLAIQGGWNGDHTVLWPPTRVDPTSSLTLDAKTFASLASSVQQVPIGSSFGLTLDGNPGAYQVLYMSLRTGPTASLRGVDGLGMLDRSGLFSLIGEVLPPSGTFATTVRVPATASLIGSTFLQNAERSPSGLPLASRFAIGNPVLVTITR
jgi:hypothetical protein